MFKPLKKFFEIIFPSRCLTCRKMISDNALFCNEDWQKLQFITEPKCKICAYPFFYEGSAHASLLCAQCIAKKPFFDSTTTIFKYNEQIKKIIFDLKYYDSTHLSKKFAQLILQKIKNEVHEYDLIVAVPLHKKRLRERKFNQAILLAQAILKEAKHIEFYPNIMLRKKYTKSQAHLKQKEREKNLSGSFVFNEKYREKIKGKNILLVDDVMTTGSTLNSCAKILKKVGCNKIRVITIAKTVLN